MNVAIAPSRPAAAAVLPARGLFIAGEWREPRGAHFYDAINPATEGVAGRVALAQAEDLDDAVHAARAALDGEWSRMSGLERGTAILSLADSLTESAEDLAWRQVVEMGKTITQSRFEIEYLINLFRYHAGWASKLDGSVKHVPGNFHCYVTHEPIGVVAAITPFNVPLYLMATKLAPALAAGCSFIHKPPTETSLSAHGFADAFARSELPKGLYNLITGRGSDVGSLIAKHPGIDKVAFTGSTEVGISITRDAAATLKHVTMELGGKSPNIICADADLEMATTNAVLGNFINSGQICTSGSRLIVERPVYDEVVERVKAKLEALVVGDPMDEKTFNGPVASKKGFDGIMSYIQKGKDEGARLVSGGEASTLNGKGWFIKPTLFADATNQMTIARDEIFGPVLTVIPVRDFDEALAVGNATQYGLASAVQTRDIKKAFKAAAVLKAGSVWINTVYQWNEAAPYGGFKMSGYGRENGREAYESYLQAETVWFDVSESAQAAG